MNCFKIYVCVAALVATAISTTDAWATHKAWLMKNSGASCVLQNPGTEDIYPGIVKNTNTFGIYVTCPVTLAARPGSSSQPSISRKNWLAAKQARIHFKEVNSPFWCQARAEDNNGAVYFSRGRWSDGPDGVQTIDLIDNANDWGGTLEAAEASNFRQLDIECRVGSRNANGTPAELYGLDVATCQNGQSCSTVQSDFRENQVWIQGSGIECGPTFAGSARELDRGVSGYYNSDPQYSQTSYCPITPATDDSYEHQRIVDRAYLYWQGTNAPSCTLVSWDYQGAKTTSPAFVADANCGPKCLRTSAAFTSGLDRSLNIRCDQPSGTTVVGWFVLHTLTRKSGGL